ncbi:MAG: Rpn family recombination-promoting nuclease/putative transposase [Candidatus Riflebacteria bacterium]|nr:Rpn family recombination-promoting nuclease/putative transposase [Candidatus Riflebacteria bacterium]
MKNLHTYYQLSDLLEMRFYELTKFGNPRPDELKSPFEKWLYILKFGEIYGTSEVSLPGNLKEEEGIDMAVEELRKVNSVDEIRQLMEARSRARHDEAQRWEDAKDEGREEGREEGKKEALKLTAKNLLSMKLSHESISLATGLSIEEIKSLVN